jgi:hypothetical protein
MTDLEEIYDQRGDQPHGNPPHGDRLAGAEKARRKTYNYRKIEALQTALADLHAAHRDLHERYAEVVAEVEEARRHIANQHDTLAAEHTTSEWAVEEAYGAQRALADHAQSVTVAYLLVGLASVVAWEILWSLGRGVWG